MANLRKLTSVELNKLSKHELIKAIQNGDDSEILKQLQDIKQLLERHQKEITDLKVKVEEKNAVVEHLEVKVNILEQRSKKNNVIISELELRSFAEVVQGGQLPTEDAQTPPPRGPNSYYTTVKKKKSLVDFAKKSLHHNMEASEINDVFQLKDRRVLVKFNKTDSKIRMMAAQREKRTKHFINDQMTRVGGELAKKCRDHKRAGTIRFTWTRLGKIFIKKTEESRTTEIQSMDDIQKVIDTV